MLVLLQTEMPSNLRSCVKSNISLSCSTWDPQWMFIPLPHRQTAVKMSGLWFWFATSTTDKFRCVQWSQIGISSFLLIFWWLHCATSAVCAMEQEAQPEVSTAGGSFGTGAVDENHQHCKQMQHSVRRYKLNGAFVTWSSYWLPYLYFSSDHP